MAININFKINDKYLLLNTLFRINYLLILGNGKLPPMKHKGDLATFLNYVRKKYNFCLDPQKTIKIPQKSLKKLINSKQYKKIRKQTKDHLIFCKKQWKKNYLITSKIIREITGLRLNKKITVYIYHPSLRTSWYSGKNKIAWGRYEDWPNYVTVYLWHEILHSYLGESDKEHAVVELIDEEIRIRLNGGIYPPFSSGHKYLNKIKRKLLPKWRKYLKLNKRNIQDFIKKP